MTVQRADRTLSNTSDANLRRFKRYRIELPVRLKSKAGHKLLLTANISRSGVFIRSDSPPPQRQLVQLTVDLGAQGLLNLVGMVVHVFPLGDPHPDAPGMGVEFFAMSKDDKTLWDRFCLEQGRQQPGDPPLLQPVVQGELTGDLPLVPALPDPASQARARQPLPASVAAQGASPLKPVMPEKPRRAVRKSKLVTLQVSPHLRRKSRRFAAVFAAQLRDKKQLDEFLTRDISIGGTFLRSKTLLPIDSQIELVLIHPESREEFEIVATVVHISKGGTQARGMGVRFAPLSERAQAEFERFVMSGVRALQAPPVDEEEIVLLEDIVDFDAKSPRAHTNIARIYVEQLRDPLAAIDELHKALDASPEYIPAHRLLQLAYALCGEQDKAYEHIQRVMQLRGGQGIDE